MVRKKSNIRSEVSNINGNIYIFSSVIVLLLAFFILLYSFSTLDLKRFKEIFSAFRNVSTGQTSDNFLKNGEYNDKPEDTIENPYASLTGNGLRDNTLKKIQGFMEQNNLVNTVEIKEDSRGVVIQLKDSLLFEAGRADLIGDSKELLDKISELLAMLPNNIEVEGHTDNTPISTYKFENNWEFSASRAINVVRYFTEVRKLNAGKFSVAGYGEHKPLVDNDTTENRAKNRRINILILSMEKERE